MRTTEGKYAYNAQTPADGGKACAKCRRWAAMAEYPPASKAKWGRSSWCRECHRKAVRDWRRRNRERENAQRREATAARRERPEAASQLKRPPALRLAWDERVKAVRLDPSGGGFRVGPERAALWNAGFFGRAFLAEVDGDRSAWLGASRPQTRLRAVFSWSLPTVALLVWYWLLPKLVNNSRWSGEN